MINEMTNIPINNNLIQRMPCIFFIRNLNIYILPFVINGSPLRTTVTYPIRSPLLARTGTDWLITNFKLKCANPTKSFLSFG